MSWENLEIWQLARDLSVDVHSMTLRELPKFEMMEVGSQIRRSAKSIRSNIVEGYGRRCYKADFIKFLVYAQASCDETRDHLNVLWETGSLRNEALYINLLDRAKILGRKINTFIEGVRRGHRTQRTPAPDG
jgi:four helix bundle protein